MGVERERIGNRQAEGTVVQEIAYVRLKGNI